VRISDLFGCAAQADLQELAAIERVRIAEHAQFGTRSRHGAGWNPHFRWLDPRSGRDAGVRNRSQENDGEGGPGEPHEPAPGGHFRARGAVATVCSTRATMRAGSRTA
jgi:hypothetical protein